MYRSNITNLFLHDKILLNYYKRDSECVELEISDEKLFKWFDEITKDKLLKVIEIPNWFERSLDNRFSTAYNYSFLHELKNRLGCKIDGTFGLTDKIRIIEYLTDEVVKVKLLENGIMPEKGREGDAAWDIYLPEKIVISKGESFCIDTKVCIELPGGYAGMFVPRSSSAKKSIFISNCLIDENYRGEIHIMGNNLSNEDYIYEKGDRIASLLIFPIFTGDLKEVKELSKSNRGESWNGSSGR